MTSSTLLVSLLSGAAILGVVMGHGRLVQPASRASAWRFGFNTPRNYDDNQLYCGGKQNQWGKQGGKCGVCGDPYQGPRQHEAGGRYATGTIVARYETGQVIEVKVQLTANHKGWFEFRMCDNNNPKKRVTPECLDRHLLKIAGTGVTRFQVSSDMRMISINLQLPKALTCTQCVLQWKYNAGNSWGIDQDTGKGCLGCGPQEQFYGCADVAISASNVALPGETSTSSTTSTSTTTSPKTTTEKTASSSTAKTTTEKTASPSTAKTTTEKTASSSTAKTTTEKTASPSTAKTTTVAPQTRATPSKTPPPTDNKTVPPVDKKKTLWCGMRCCAVSPWKAVQGMHQWCNWNCPAYCPQSHCECAK